MPSREESGVGKASDVKMADMEKFPTWSETEKERWHENRRFSERIRYGRATPKGPWDEDLTMYQSSSYRWDNVKGFTVYVRRSPWLSWNGYVKLPADHILNAVSHYNFFERLPEGVPEPPMPITYGGHNEPGVFGFDHTWQGRDLMPRWPMPQAPCATFKDRKTVYEECVALLDWFNTIATDHADAIKAMPKHYCEQCCEFFHEPTKVAEDKLCCGPCEAEVRKEAREIRIAVADQHNYAKQKTERTIKAEGARTVANKGDMANAGAIYAAMMAKKKKKGKGGKK